MAVAYIALGSNLDNPLQQVTLALNALGEVGKVTARSSWYLSKAIGPAEMPEYTQPDYVNGVACLETPLDAHSLLQALQSMEHRQGRVRTLRWGARTLDLDLLLFNNDTLDTPTLTIPHPRMTERHFVMVPLAEIAPGLILPDGRSAASVAGLLHRQGLEKLPQNS